MEEVKAIPCIKCGREIGPDAVFCEECLADMERHPVKPGTPVILHQKPAFVRRNPSRKVKKTEEQIRGLKRTVAWLWALIVLLALALGVVTYFWLTRFGHQASTPLPGENFQTSQTQGTSR